MVLRRIVNSAIVGGMLGTALSSHMAQEHWRTKDMYSERDDRAVAGAAVDLATRRDLPPPERTAYMDPRDPQTLFIPEDPPPEPPRRLTRSERHNERRRLIQPGPRRDPIQEDFSRAWQTTRRGHL